MLSCQKHLFDLPDDVHYLNCAYMGPLLKTSAAIGQLEITKRARPFLYQRSDFFAPVQSLKENYSKLINNPTPDRVALIPSASYGIANAAKNISCTAGQKILIVGEQFPSNYYSWERLAKESGAQIKIITAPISTINRTQLWNQHILDHIDQHTAVVAMPIVHWADGTLFDLKAIREKSNRFDAALVIDGTQSIGALPFDVNDIQPDALICGSYKWMFGPYGLGLAYYGPKFDQGAPIEENWINRKDSEQFENLVNYQAEYKPQAARYMMGEHSNFIYVSMLDAAIRQLIAWQPIQIQAYCKALVSPYLQKMQSMGFEMASEKDMAFHLFGIRMPEQVDIFQLKSLLEKEKIFISIRGNAIRVASNVYNENKNLERLLYCLEEVVFK